jgi:CheY-like chemotaxis protein
LAREFLEAAGYNVIQACNGQEALKRAAEYSAQIDLLVTDLVMPGITGQQLAALLQQERVGLGVIFMSGYSEHAAAEAAQAGSSVRILTKPFNRGALLRAVRHVLGVARKS